VYVTILDYTNGRVIIRKVAGTDLEGWLDNNGFDRSNIEWMGTKELSLEIE